MRTSRLSHVAAIVLYCVVAVAFSWPLATHLGTHLTGTTTGDTGVYVWNQWVFQHELLDHHQLPYFTNTLFGPRRTANLSLHNYTTFQNLLALPLIRLLGVVTTFNVVYLVMAVVTAYGTFLLAYRLTRRVPESWLAGFAFAWSPFIVTRGMGHFSVAAAAPLPVFLLLLDRAAERQRLRDAVALGATAWWAASCDVYYAVYCVMIGALFVTARVVRLHRNPLRTNALAIRWAVDVVGLSLAALVAAIIVRGGFKFEVLGRPARMHSLYTPMLLLTVLACVRAAWYYRPSLVPVTRADLWRLARLASAAGLAAAVMLSPVLYAVGVRIADGEFVSPRIFWRSSPPGVDVLALLLPNPNHPLAPSWLAAWVDSLKNGYLENVASIPLVVLATLLLAARAGWRPPRWLATVTLTFGLLALGPFVTIGSVNTSIPGPWALVRYAPVIGLARTPARFAVMLTLGLAVLFAAALEWVGRRRPEQRRRLLIVVAALLAFELLPAPLMLQSAAIPSIYRRVAAAPADVIVLELPWGVRDGTSSAGNFTSRTQFFQTAHGKTIMGGYLSRVSVRRVRELQSNHVLSALLTLSENQPLWPSQASALDAEGPRFIRNNRIGFVVVDRDRASTALRDAAIRAFHLERVEVDGPFELYVPEGETARVH